MKILEVINLPKFKAEFLKLDEKGMAALTPTDVKNTEFSGDLRVRILTVDLESASDTVDLSSFFEKLYAVIPVLEGGADAALMAGIQASFSGTDVTLVSQQQAGTAATNWTNGTVRLIVIGRDYV